MQGRSDLHEVPLGNAASGRPDTPPTPLPNQHIVTIPVAREYRLGPLPGGYRKAQVLRLLEAVRWEAEVLHPRGKHATVYAATAPPTPLVVTDRGEIRIVDVEHAAAEKERAQRQKAEQERTERLERQKRRLLVQLDEPPAPRSPGPENATSKPSSGQPSDGQVPATQQW